MVIKKIPLLIFSSFTSSSSGVLVFTSGDGGGECASGGAATLQATFALPCWLWYCAARAASLFYLSHGDPMEATTQGVRQVQL